jgi:hypothetical protein
MGDSFFSEGEVFMSGAAASNDAGVYTGMAPTGQMSPGVEQIEAALSQAEDLKKWWAEVEAGNAALERFELFPAYPGMEPTIGFFGEALVQGQTIPVMGDVGDYFFDQPRVPDSEQKQAAQWMVEQVEEFALHYWMRVQAWALPQSYPELDQLQAPRYFQGFSWCFPANPELSGMGNLQRYFKLRAGDVVGEFPASDRAAIIDLRKLQTTFAWITVDRRLFDFDITVGSGNGRLSLALPIGTTMHLVLNQNLIVNQPKPNAGILAEFGVGFGLIRDPVEGVIAFGLDSVQPGLELQFLRVRDSGEVRLRTVTILARPKNLLNLSINPLDWGLQIADLATPVAARWFTKPAEKALKRLSRPGFGPLLASFSLLNPLIPKKGGSPLFGLKEHFEKEMLAKDALGLRQALLGTRMTWLQVTDWVNGPIPPWVRQGKIASLGGTK